MTDLDREALDAAFRPLCEVCEKPILGEPVVDPEEGTDFCGPCVASLLSAEVKQLEERIKVTTNAPYAYYAMQDRAEKAEAEVKQLREAQAEMIAEMIEDLAHAVRSHTRAIHALAGNLDYPAEEQSDVGRGLAEALAGWRALSSGGGDEE